MPPQRLGDIPAGGPDLTPFGKQFGKAVAIVINALFHQYSWGREFELENQLAQRMKMLGQPASARAERSGHLGEFPHLKAHHPFHFILFLFEDQ